MIELIKLMEQVDFHMYSFISYYDNPASDVSEALSNLADHLMMEHYKIDTEGWHWSEIIEWLENNAQI